MDTSVYILERLAEARLDELRAQARLSALRSSAADGRGGGVRLGRALARAGRWLLRPHGRARRGASAGVLAGPRPGVPCADCRGSNG
jgi:hypothetical protein